MSLDTGAHAVSAAICQLESDLVTAWLKRPEVRKLWPMVASEFYSPHIQLLATAALALPEGLPGDLCGQLGCAPEYRRKLLESFGDDPWFSLEHVSDVSETRAKVRCLRALLLVQAGALEAVLGVSPSTDLQSVLSGLREALEAGELITRKSAYSEQSLFGLTVDSLSGAAQPGLTTGFAALDSLTGGIRPEQVWAFGAPTNWGKSSWLLALVDRWKRIHNRRVLYVTCEDSPAILASRLLSRRLNINGKDIRDNSLPPEHRAAIVDAYANGSTDEMMLDGRGLDVDDMATAIRARIKGDGVELVLIDYLQCINTKKKHQDRRNEINYISQTLTRAIKDNGAAGVLASQMTEGNLRESRDLENAAEVVVIGRQDDPDNQGERVLFLKKNKTGPKGMVIEAPWDENTGSFVNMTGSEKIVADDDLWDL